MWQLKVYADSRLQALEWLMRDVLDVHRGVEGGWYKLSRGICDRLSTFFPSSSPLGPAPAVIPLDVPLSVKELIPSGSLYAFRRLQRRISTIAMQVNSMKAIVVHKAIRTLMLPNVVNLGTMTIWCLVLMLRQFNFTISPWCSYAIQNSYIVSGVKLVIVYVRMYGCKCIFPYSSCVPLLLYKRT